MTYPKFIALCGHPGAGKTTVQNILSDDYNYHSVDDGMFLREIAFNHLGLSWDMVSTPEGKDRHVVINGRDWRVRDVLGELGNAFEEKFGADVIPEIAIRDCTNPTGRYVFGSVRRQQGHYYAARGARVIEVQNPVVGPSQYEFDVFDKDCVHATIVNDWQTAGENEEEPYARLKKAVALEMSKYEGT